MMINDQMTQEQQEAGIRRQMAFQTAYNSGAPQRMRRFFFPRVSRLDPAKFHGDCWAIDGRRSERYTAKTWRMGVHVVLALVFG